MEEKQKNIKKLAILIAKLQLLCEGFNENNKDVLFDTKFKILLHLSCVENISPSILKIKVGLAKGNLTAVCNDLMNKGLVEKTRDNFDNRSIFYSITTKGQDELNSVLNKMEKNLMQRIDNFSMQKLYNDIDAILTNLNN